MDNNVISGDEGLIDSVIVKERCLYKEENSGAPSANPQYEEKSPSPRGRKSDIPVGDDQTIARSSFDDLDRDMREDIRRKKEAAILRDDMRCQQQGPVPIAIGLLSGDDKTSLAMGISAATMPGAYDSESPNIRLKPSQSQIMDITQLSRAQKLRESEYQTDSGLKECQPDTEYAIDELQYQMNAFQAHVVLETVVEDAQKQKECERKKETRKHCWICVAAMVIITVIVSTVAGIVVGSSTKSIAEDDVEDDLSPSYAPTFLDVLSNPCSFSGSNVTSERYIQFRSATIARLPSMAASIDASLTNIQEAALCWLSDIDMLQISAEEIRIQRFVLAMTYFRLVNPELAEMTTQNRGGLSNKNWLTGVHECDWDLVTCDVNKEVVNLRLNYLGLVGRIPTELSMLTNLGNLDLTSNSLTGELPSQLWSMTRLARLAMSKNELSGTISGDVKNLRRIISLLVDENKLTGILPDLSDLTQLRKLNMGGNQFQGTAPDMSSSTNLGKETDNI